MPGWNNLKNLIKEEMIQRSEEGCDISGFEEKWQAAATDARLMEIYDELQALPVKSDFKYVEPSHLEGIRLLRANPTPRKSVKIDDTLYDRVYGAWLGRIAGCMLGKPVEGWIRDQIHKYLVGMGEYPLTDYIPAAGEKLPDGVDRAPHAGCARGAWDHAIADDDTNYTVIGLRIMEEKGVDFTTDDVGHIWLGNLPYNQVCTAERQAYMNMINGLPLCRVPSYLNPYREWIGAQIRADFWGYCAPGWPEKAAEFAYRDAALTHLKNGIYGEMMCAAMISAALVTDDVNEIIEAGVNEVPSTSRIAETVSDCLRWRKECSTWEEAFEKLSETYYGKYNWVHTNNNLAVVLIAMLYGWPDYEKVATIAVMQGWDTDCNGATAGSIAGAALGAKAMPEKWIKPLGGKLDTAVFGFMQPKIEELAQRTMKQIERVAAL